MSGTELHFFLCRNSISAIFKACESKFGLRYTRTGPASPTAGPEAYGSIEKIPGLGASEFGNSVADPRYLITPADVIPKIRTVRLNAGGSRGMIDQLENPDSLVVGFGGMHDSGMLVSGGVSTARAAPFSSGLFAALRSELKSIAKKHKAFWVDEPSLALLRSGTRLTTDVRGSRDSDLVISS